MSGKNMIFNNKKINLRQIDVNKVLVSKKKKQKKNKETYVAKNSLKYFIGYNDDDVIRPLYIKFPQMIGYGKCFDSNKTMSVKASDNKLLKKYPEIWE